MGLNRARLLRIILSLLAEAPSSSQRAQGNKRLIVISLKLTFCFNLAVKGKFALITTILLECAKFCAISNLAVQLILRQTSISCEALSSKVTHFLLFRFYFRSLSCRLALYVFLHFVTCDIHFLAYSIQMIEKKQFICCLVLSERLPATSRTPNTIPNNKATNVTGIILYKLSEQC